MTTVVALNQEARTIVVTLYPASGAADLSAVVSRVDALESAQLPAGGAAGQVLAKAATADFVTEWVTVGGTGVETDPVFAASPAAGIGAQDITDWDTAVGWGDHSTAGYLTTFTELDPTVAGAITAHEGAADPHAAYALESALGGAALLNVGATTGTVAAGDDSRLSDARTPTAHAASHQNGGADEIATATAAANAIPKTGAGATLDVGWLPVGTVAGTVAAGDDARFTAITAVGSGVNFFPTDTAIIAAGANNTYPVKTLSNAPSGAAEDVDSIVIPAGTTVMYGTYLSPILLNEQLDGGIWEFHIYAGVDSATGVTQLIQNVYRVRPASGTVTITGTGTSRTATASTGTPFATANIDASAAIADCSFVQTPLGLYPITARTSDTVVTITTPTGYTNESAVAFSVHKKLFGVTSGEINVLAGTGPAYAGIILLPELQSVQNDIPLEAGDRLATAFLGTSTSSRTLYFAHDGTTRYTHLHSPLTSVVDLATSVSGTLAVANGGTGQTALANINAADLGSGSATDNYVLTADGSGGAAWEAAAGGGGSVDVSGTPAATNYARWVDADTLEARTVAQVRTDIAPAEDVQTFSASGTWTKPTGGQTWAEVFLVAAGSGGGSGRVGTTTTNRSGGSGGTGGATAWRLFRLADLASSVTVTIGAGGAGGAGVTADSTNGNPGTAGGATSFGSLVAPVGTPGAGGSTAGLTGPTGAVGYPSKGGDGGSTNTGGAATAPVGSPLGGGGGGPGGSLSATNVVRAAAAGGPGSPGYVSDLIAGGAAGTAGGAGSAGDAASDASSVEPNATGGGGGGGAATTTANGGAGGAGGFPGGGGGGSASASDGYDSGAGGAGANGYARVRCF